MDCPPVENPPPADPEAEAEELGLKRRSSKGSPEALACELAAGGAPKNASNPSEDDEAPGGVADVAEASGSGKEAAKEEAPPDLAAGAAEAKPPKGSESAEPKGSAGPALGADLSGVPLVDVEGIEKAANGSAAAEGAAAAAAAGDGEGDGNVVGAGVC